MTSASNRHSAAVMWNWHAPLPCWQPQWSRWQMWQLPATCQPHMFLPSHKRSRLPQLVVERRPGNKKTQKPTIWQFRLVNNLERVNPPPLGYRRQAFCISKLRKQDDLVDKQQQSANIFSMSQWIGLRENLQETHGFLASNLKGFPVNFPIIQFYECLPQTEPSLILQYLQVLR